jgi:very-short-patch-repair endonuclease
VTRLYNAKLKQNAQSLRREMTKEERKLWHLFLKNLPYNFYRQRVFDKYIVDFYCAEKHIVIELDGSQHYEDEAVVYDKMRDEYFYNLGIQVLRFSNRQVNENFSTVCNEIERYLR